jgi:benzoate-CoA ligase
LTDIPVKFNFARYIFEKNLGNKIAVIDDNSSISYRELEMRSRGFANSLMELGLTREDRVMIVMPDSVQSSIAILGCILGGFVAVLTNPWTSIKTMRTCIESSAAKAIIFANNRTTKAIDIIECLKNTDHQPHHIIALEQLKTMSVESDYDPPATLRDSDAFWMFTSGSTGEIKSVVHSHQSMISVGLGYGAAVGYQYNDIVFATSKLFFSWGISSTFICPLTVGATTILHGKLHTPASASRIFNTHQPTVFASVPSFYVSLLNSKMPMSYKSLRMCISAGEAITNTMQKNWQQATNLAIVDGYGSTELLAPVIVTGELVPGFDACVKDSDSNNIQNQIGELYVRGPSMALRYQNDTEKSRATFIGEWCRTGDKFIQLGTKFEFIGRSKDMLKINANWVSPVEIENVLMSHNLVLEAGVTGVENSNELTEIVAYVVIDCVAQVPTNLDHQLKLLVKQNLDYYKCPKYIRMVNKLPKNTNGKIQRYLLNTNCEQSN